MTSAQRKSLTNLQERIIQNRLSKTDTSWVETEQEMTDLKQAIIRESMNIRESNNIVYVSDYSNEMNYMIFVDGFVSEKKADYSSVSTSKKIHKISGFMIFGWLVLLIASMLIYDYLDLEKSLGLETGEVGLICIVLGIINLFVFRISGE